MGSIKYSQKSKRRPPGKITAPLDKKLQTVEWGEFRIGDLFEKIKTNNVINNKKGNLPATTAILSNNQIGKYIDSKGATILKSVFSATANGFGKVFYQPNKFTVLQDSYAFEFKDKSITIEKIHGFIVGSLNRIFIKYNWADKSGWTKIKEEKIKLPVKNGKINFSFMEKFIAELEAKHLAELEAYLLATGLKDYQLTAEEQQALDEFENMEFADFDLVKEFTVKNTGNILSRDIVRNSGSVPYLCASAENNSVSSYITYDENYLDKGNCVFIGGKTFVVSYQEKDFYSNDSHNLVLYLNKKENRTKLTQLYLATCINKSLSHKYSWGDSISNRKIQTDKISLPILNGKANYKTMETLISAIQKLVIKDVVRYAEQKEQLTARIINK